MENSKDHNELKRKIFIHLFREVFQFLNFLISSYVLFLLMLLRPEKILTKSLYYLSAKMPRVEIFAKCSYWWRVRAEEISLVLSMNGHKFPGQQPMLHRDRRIASKKKEKLFFLLCLNGKTRERRRRRWAGGIKSRLTASRK
jgi:hypothetical protein